jgi:aromatic ring-opening dioxygenase LigB subunit
VNGALGVARVAVRPAIAGLLPHPPIVVADVGRERTADCRATVDGCEKLAQRVAAARPARLLLISPHSPRRKGAFGLWNGPRLGGDLSAFGAAAAAIDLPNDEAMVARLGDEARARGVATWAIPAGPLDHGAVVPLWFLAGAGWSGPTTIASLPAGAAIADLTRFGEAVASALAAAPGRPALIASGDMTHRARPGAPSGYHPRAVDFDRELTELVRTGRLDRIAAIDPALRALAAEDATESSIVVAAATGFVAHGAEVLSYEHPFGVGYLVALLHDGGPA